MVNVAAQRVEKAKKYHHGNLRAALIEASLKLIVAKGVRALTLREIGSIVGVSRMAPYRHFADKAELLGAISEAGFEKFANALEAAKAKAPLDFALQLEAMAVAYVRFSLEYQPYYEVMFGALPGTAPRGGPAGERAFGILRQTIAEGQASGAVRPGSSLLLARAVWSLVHGISTLQMEKDMSEHGAGTQFVLFCSEVMKTGLLQTNGPTTETVNT